MRLHPAACLVTVETTLYDDFIIVIFKFVDLSNNIRLNKYPLNPGFDEFDFESNEILEAYQLNN